jgi:DNA-binding protein H-NS
MSEELNNNELSTSMVEAGESVIPQDINPVVEEVVKAEEPIVAPEPEVAPEPVVAEAPATENAITTPRYEAPSEEVQALGSVANGAIGATTAPKSVKKAADKKTPAKKETVAIHSTKNVTWSGVGKVYRGYNIVDKDAADKWLTRDHIRIATPQEVAKEFGK